MPIILQGTEYLTTQEASKALGICAITWRKIAKQRNINPTIQVGKSNRFLWRKIDIDPLLKPIPQGEKR